MWRSILRNIVTFIGLSIAFAAIRGCGGGEAEQRAAQGNPPPNDVVLPSHDLNSIGLEPNGGSYTVVFHLAKTTHYYCRDHGGPFGEGESGIISVMEAGEPKLHIVNVTSGYLPNLTIGISDTVTFINQSDVVHTLQTVN